jgi:hypothetical protein
MHGNVQRPGTASGSAKKLSRRVCFFLPAYSACERFRAGERISSCLAESTVNAVISNRFAKRQQMQWTKRGAHLLLQMRTRALDGFANDNGRGANLAVGA